MREIGKSGFWSGMVNCLLGGAVVALALVSVVLVVSEYPSLWGRCIRVLDTRDWTLATWRGVVVGLVVCLLAIRLWPDRADDVDGEGR